MNKYILLPFSQLRTILFFKKNFVYYGFFALVFLNACSIDPNRLNIKHSKVNKKYFKATSEGIIAMGKKYSINQDPFVHGYRFIRFLRLDQNSKYVTFAGVFESKDNSSILITIRGTKNSNEFHKDLQTDLVTFYPFNEPVNKKMKVERGFYSEYKAIRNDAFEFLSKVKDKKIIIAGHSLGGAVSTLLAYDCYNHFKLPVSLYIYGAPKVGNKEFIENLRYFISKGLDAVFFVNLKDIVPKLPLTLNYTNYPPERVERSCFYNDKLYGSHKFENYFRVLSYTYLNEEQPNGIEFCNGY